jgi:hypothetical protein
MTPVKVDGFVCELRTSRVDRNGWPYSHLKRFATVTFGEGDLVVEVDEEQFETIRRGLLEQDPRNGRLRVTLTIEATP